MNLKLDADGADVFLGKILGDILFHIQAIEKYSKDITPDEFAENEQIQDAISMRLQTLGERLKLITGKNISDDPYGIISLFPEIHWSEIKGMRDVLAHDYSSLDIQYPWAVLNNDLPRIKKAISDICKNFPVIKTATEFSVADLKYRREKKKKNFREIFERGEEDEENDAEGGLKPQY